MSLELLISIAIPALLIVVGRVVGSSIERKHYASIEDREARFHGQPALSTKQSDAPGAVRSARQAGEEMDGHLIPPSPPSTHELNTGVDLLVVLESPTEFADSDSQRLR